MRNLWIAILAAVVLTTSACSPRDFLTRRLASDLIAGSDTFKSAQQFWLRTGIVSNKDYLSPEYLVLQRHGWIVSSSAPCPANLVPPPCWDVTLTPIGIETFRDLVPNNGAASQYFSVLVAKRELISVSGISKSGDTAEVDFQWKWVPLNEVGGALYTGEMKYTSSVTFRHYDDGWRVVEGAPKSNQGLDDALKNAEPAQ